MATIEVDLYPLSRRGDKIPKYVFFTEAEKEADMEIAEKRSFHGDVITVPEIACEHVVAICWIFQDI